VETVIYLLLGFVLLWKGGELLVQGADMFARSHGVPTTLAGVFILGFGTSLPELAVSAKAAVDGNVGIAVGNVVGSNIANIALVLGTAVFLTRTHVNRFLLRLELPVCILASVIGFLVVQDGTVDRGDGAMLLIGFGAYAAFALFTVKQRPIDEEERPRKRAWYDLGMAALALAAVVGGAEFFTTGAVRFAAWAGVSETVIGLTLVALGTSLPELSTAIAAARRKKVDLVVGNVIGSNIFNLLMVLGVAGILQPQVLEERVATLDMPIALGLVIFVLVVGLVRGQKLERPVGFFLLVVYLGFILGLSFL
jgi:cation:H+ antiporter